jgi:alpha-amylase/alpha-mannosidase (GH57 family)
MNTYVCLHGHFYQPPRENPWLDEIELQESAHPYHDWNERITAECYAPNTAARILDAEKRIAEIVNNFRSMSFNVGPTLLSWLERKAPDVYRAILKADRLSRERFSGHGAAIAQVYNHLIMPLANSRDKRTQIIWGAADFRRRFGRRPEGMWLAETAVDLETLEILAEEGILFTILAPGQAARIRRIGETKWRDVTSEAVDPGRPYLCSLPSGRTISLFFFNGPISREIAFGNLLNNGENLALRLAGSFSSDPQEPQITHAATDGETFGHHKRFGDMALAYCLKSLEERSLARLTVYGEYLGRFPPSWEAEIIENTSWSCAHGIGRWKEDCGCRTGGGEGWRQAWRGPLREAMDWLRDELAPFYRREMSRLVRDPWEARDDYISVISDRSSSAREAFLSRSSSRPLSPAESTRALQLLEMQRHALLMYTSCGWFFNDISGIETVQVMAFAARAIQLARAAGGKDLEDGYLARLKKAPGNLPEYRDGAKVYEKLVRPSVVDLQRVGAHYAISSVFHEYPSPASIFSYSVRREKFEIRESGRHRLALGQAVVRSEIDGAEGRVCFAVLHLGDHRVIARVAEDLADKDFSALSDRLREPFSGGHLPGVMSILDSACPGEHYTLKHLFKDEGRRILQTILNETMAEIEDSFRQISRRHQPIMRILHEASIPVPPALIDVMEFVLDKKLRQALKSDPLNEPGLRALAEERREWSLSIDRAGLGYILTDRINAWMEELSRDPYAAGPARALISALSLAETLSLNVNLWQAQNVYFSVSRSLNGKEEKKLPASRAKTWSRDFRDLGDFLRIRPVGPV